MIYRPFVNTGMPSSTSSSIRTLLEYRGRDDDRDYIDKQIISVKYVWFKGLMMAINDDEDDELYFNLKGFQFYWDI